jgi:hypothetical protein
LIILENDDYFKDGWLLGSKIRWTGEETGLFPRAYTCTAPKIIPMSFPNQELVTVGSGQDTHKASIASSSTSQAASVGPTRNILEPSISSSRQRNLHPSIPQLGTVSNGQIPAHESPLFVFLMAATGPLTKVSQISITRNTTTSAFFMSLKFEYLRLRGFLRRWFSVWRYSHCEFYQAISIKQHQCFSESYLNNLL